MPVPVMISLGTILMVLVIGFSGKKFNVSMVKRIILAIVLTVMGVLGTKLMTFIENGDFSGLSFFGAVLFTPFLMIPVALLLKIRISDCLDLCAPAECAMLFIMKIDCQIHGCCFGKVVAIVKVHPVRFPSQLVESATAVVVLCILLILLYKSNQHGLIYPWYLLIYGVVRFALNLFRETTPFIWNIPAGNFWALICVITGSLILLLVNIRRHTSRLQSA